MNSHATLLGLDIGGSKTRAVLTRGAEVVNEVTVGTANLASVGAEGVGLALDDLIAHLARGQVDAVCAGAAGADSVQSSAQLRSLLEQRFPRAQVEVVHDTRIILAAAGLDAGIVLVSGTGSACWGRRESGEQARAGGWGYLLGDEGSGYAVARDAVRQALGEVDAGAEPSSLSRHLTAACGLDEPWQLLQAFYATPERAHWARRSAVVFDLAHRGDQTCRDIVGRAAGSLAELILDVGRRLRLRGPVVLAGGLAVHQPMLVDGVRRRLGTEQLPDVHVLSEQPVLGALRLAGRMLAEPVLAGVSGLKPPQRSRP